MSIAFYRGDVLKLFDDIQTVQPTIFPSVPRLLTRLHDKIKHGVESTGGVKKWMFDLAYSQKKSMLNSGILSKDTIWDHLIFGKIQAKTGGKIRAIISGAAAISPDVLEFLRIVLGCQLIEGYGQSENCAAASMSGYGVYKDAHCGMFLIFDFLVSLSIKKKRTVLLALSLVSAILTF